MNKVKIQLDQSRFYEVFCRPDSSDRGSVWQIWERKDYDLTRLRRWPEIKAKADHILSSNQIPLVLDIGANIGVSALYFAEFIRGSAVIALEPDVGNYQMLLKNTEQCSRIHPVHGAIASSNGHVRIFDPGEQEWGFRTASTESALPPDAPSTRETVKSLTIDRLIEFAPERTVPLIAKIDIEGAEEDLFSKNVGWIDLFPMVIVELHDWLMPGLAKSRNFLAAVASSGRDFVYIGENVFSIKN